MKAEIRKSAIHDVGVRLDDLLETTRGEISRADGRISAFTEAARVPTALAAAVRKDIDDGKLDLAVADVICQWLAKTTTAMENLAKGAAMEKVAATGKVAGLRVAVEVTKALHSAEEAKQSVVASLSSDEAREVPHAAPVKLRRLAGQVGPSGKKRRQEKPDAANT